MIKTLVTGCVKIQNHRKELIWIRTVDKKKYKIFVMYLVVYKEDKRVVELDYPCADLTVATLTHFDAKHIAPLFGTCKHCEAAEADAEELTRPEQKGDAA